MNNKKGFSLIELIIVIAIIVVISAIGVASYQGANKKSRDNKRKADLEQIRNALEMYRSDSSTGEYPATTGALVTGYLSEWPQDPKSGYSYYYNRTSSYAYDLCTTLESPGVTPNCGTASCGTGITCNYKKTNP